MRTVTVQVVDGHDTHRPGVHTIGWYAEVDGVEYGNFVAYASEVGERERRLITRSATRGLNRHLGPVQVELA